METTTMTITEVSWDGSQLIYPTGTCFTIEGSPDDSFSTDDAIKYWCLINDRDPQSTKPPELTSFVGAVVEMIEGRLKRHAARSTNPNERFQFDAMLFKLTNHKDIIAFFCDGVLRTGNIQKFVSGVW